MKARPAFRSPRCALTALFAFGLVSEVSAQSVSTTPVGAVTLTIAAGTGTTRVLTPIAFPLMDTPSGVGQLKGQVTGFTASTITNSNAGWVDGQFSNAAIPYLIRITSGASAGKTFLISTSVANTTTTITVDSEEAGLVDIANMGLVAGDTYSIIPCDTISSLFGAPAGSGVIGGTSATDADIIYLMVSGAWRQYYYKTDGTPGWKRVGLNSTSDNVPVRPDALIMYSRIGSSPMNLVLTGEVPSLTRRQITRQSGVTPLSNPWPSGLTTLSSSGIGSSSGWVKNAQSAQADLVYIMISGAWRQYYHDGTNWRRVGLNTVSDSVEIPSGSGVMISKRGGLSSSVDIVSVAPYSF